MKRSYEMDMCHGPVFGKLVRFAIPLILSGMLQFCFNAADVIVVGRFTGKEALAAVGCTSSFVNLMINLFTGVSVGVNVLVARYYGSKSEREIEETVHTSIALALICGIAMMATGLIACGPILRLMGTTEDVLPLSEIYLRIYFLGVPAMVLYNFGAAVLRAVGDTKRPLYFLTAAGIINVIFNLIFVIVFDLGVAGVAIATTMSQIISAVLVLSCLCKDQAVYRLHIRNVRLHKEKLLSILKIGLPAGFQGMMFNISNMLVQSSVNSFGTTVMAGNTAGANVDSFLNTASVAVQQTAISFISQNMGAGQFKRINRILFGCLGLIVGIELVLGLGGYGLAPVLLHIYSPDNEVVAYGIIRMSFIAAPYAVNGIQDCMAGALRGLGYSIAPTAVALIAICGFRILWLSTIFRVKHTLPFLYMTYPISWILAISGYIFFYVRARRRLKALKSPSGN